MKIDHTALIICIAAALLILGTAVFLSLWLDPMIGVLAGGGAFVLLVCAMLILNRKNK